METHNRLRDLRKRAGIPIEVLARKARCSYRQIWLWERWGVLPKRPIAERIAHALGVNLEELGYSDSERQEV